MPSLRARSRPAQHKLAISMAHLDTELCHLSGKLLETSHFSGSQIIHCKKLGTGSWAKHLLRDKRSFRDVANQP